MKFRSLRRMGGSLVILILLACESTIDDEPLTASLSQTLNHTELGEWVVDKRVGDELNDVIAIHAAVTRYGDVLYFSGQQYTAVPQKECASSVDCNIPKPTNWETTNPGEDWVDGGGRCVQDGDGIVICNDDDCQLPKGYIAQDCQDGSACHCNWGVGTTDGYRLYRPDPDGGAGRLLRAPRPQFEPLAPNPFTWDTFCSGHTWDGVGKLVVA